MLYFQLAGGLYVSVYIFCAKVFIVFVEAIEAVNFLLVKVSLGLPVMHGCAAGGICYT